jgi:hypothetical protein
MKLLSQLLLAPALALGLSATAMAQTASPYDALLTLTPATGTVTTVGGSLTYNINISQLQNNTDAPQALADYDLFIDYNAADLSVTGATINSTPMNVGNAGDSPYTGSAGSGQYELSDFSLDDNSTESHNGLGDFSSQATSFTIGTITFKSLAAGTSAITFDSSSNLGDQNSNNIVYDPTGSTASVVPEPSTIGLLLLAAAGFVGSQLRRRKSA